MRRRLAIVAATVCSVLLFSICTAAGTSAAGSAPPAGLMGIWGTAEVVPGTAALNSGGAAAVTAMSCASPGDCSAGGSYRDGLFHIQVFVVGQSNGTWGMAEEVPGTAALNKGGSAQVTSVSCASVGNCSAGGDYTDGSFRNQAFVVGQSNGTWGMAEEVPGTAALNKGGSAQVTSVSCASVGNCSAGGFYLNNSGHAQAFVVSETGGTWGMAEEVPGTVALNKGGTAQVASVSCASVGNCSAGGSYRDGSGHMQAFDVAETNGTWGNAKEVPGIAALNTGGAAQLTSVSCASVGSCSAGGDYLDGSGHAQAFAVTETNGTWGNAKRVPGTAALNTGGAAQLTSVSCASVGNCSAGGFYRDAFGNIEAFVVRQTNGMWGNAKEVPGTAALNTGGDAAIAAVSCASAGNCGAGGVYTDSSHHRQAFVVSEANGTWGAAREVPGTAALNTGGNAEIISVSCAAAGKCSAGGRYEDGASHRQAFVVSET